MNIDKKLKQWAKLKAELDQLEAEIREGVLRLGSTKEVETPDGFLAIARFGQKAKYDYQKMAEFLNPPKHLIKRHSSIVIDWRKVVEANGVPLDVKESFKTLYPPHVTMQLKRVKQ